MGLGEARIEVEHPAQVDLLRRRRIALDGGRILGDWFELPLGPLHQIVGSGCQSGAGKYQGKADKNVSDHDRSSHGKG
jgi:hypothetical protein